MKILSQKKYVWKYEYNELYVFFISLFYVTLFFVTLFLSPLSMFLFLFYFLFVYILLFFSIFKFKTTLCIGFFLSLEKMSRGTREEDAIESDKCTWELDHNYVENSKRWNIIVFGNMSCLNFSSWLSRISPKISQRFSFHKFLTFSCSYACSLLCC